MALFDDRRFLLSHINHSFITGDDTGICEVVMLDDDVFKNQHQRCLQFEGQDNSKPEDRLDPQAYDLDYESELFESEQGQSYDIDYASDLDYVCHRRRSNTAQRLDRLKKEKINQSRTKTIVWRCNSPTSSQSEERLSQDSPTSIAGDVVDGNTKAGENGSNRFRLSKSPPRKSGLTRLLEKYPSLPKNPFDEFAQFDGGMSEAVPVKKIMIFIALNQQNAQKSVDNNNELNHQSNNYAAVNSNAAGSRQDTLSNANTNDVSIANNYNSITNQKIQLNNNSRNTPTKPKTNEPLEVVIVSTARVQDLIGLICWQYTNEGREPKLHHDISRYCLRIAEDNGEVDPDFTSLNPKEPLSKFNFPSLALSEKSEERVRSYNNTYTDGNIYINRLPTIAQNVITSSTKLSNVSSRFTALTRIIFKDAKLDTNQ